MVIPRELCWKLLEIFNIHKAKPISTPLAGHFKLSVKQSPTTEKNGEMKNVPYSSAVGSLMYAMICTRPNIAYIVGFISWFMTNPWKEQWTIVEWILRYLRGTTKKCLCFDKEKPMLVGYINADLAGDIDSRKSTSGYLSTFVVGAVPW